MMADNSINDDDNRNFSRLAITKLAFAKDGAQARGGLLKDLSTSGAFLEFEYPLGHADHDFNIGDQIELILEDETTLSGTVKRTEDNGVAIYFDRENEELRQFVQAMVEAEWEIQQE